MFGGENVALAYSNNYNLNRVRNKLVFSYAYFFVARASKGFSYLISGHYYLLGIWRHAKESNLARMVLEAVLIPDRMT